MCPRAFMWVSRRRLTCVLEASTTACLCVASRSGRVLTYTRVGLDTAAVWQPLAEGLQLAPAGSSRPAVDRRRSADDPARRESPGPSVARVACHFLQDAWCGAARRERGIGVGSCLLGVFYGCSGVAVAFLLCTALPARPRIVEPCTVPAWAGPSLGSEKESAKDRPALLLGLGRVSK